MNVRYHPLAREEVIEATAYYGGIRPTLGAEFLAEFNSAVEMISANPPMFEEVRSRIRRCLMD